MAARIRKHHQDEIRAKIQASQLVNVLQKHALGEGGEISPSRMKAIEILLRKSLADLTATEISGSLEMKTAAQELAELNANAKARSGS